MDEKKSIISELIELSKVDGKVSEEEVALIKAMGNMIGLTDEQMIELFENPVPFTPQASAIDRITQFHRMVLLMNVDQHTAEEEKRHLQFMGIKLGLSPGAIDEILRRMYDYPNNVIPPNELIAIYKKHMN